MAQTAVKLVGNFDATGVSVVPIRTEYAQSFRTGSSGGVLTRVDIRTWHENTSIAIPAHTVTINSDSGGRPGASLGTLTNPGSFPTTAGPASYTAPSDGIDLQASTTYWLMIDVTEMGNNTVNERYETQSDAEDGDGASGWSIGNGSLYRGWEALTDWNTDTTSLIFAVYGPEPPQITAPPLPPPPPPVITSAQGVTYSGNAGEGFSLTPLGEGGHIVYRRRTIDLPVTRDECQSPDNPAVIISRSILDRVREITFELQEVSPHDPPPGFRMEGCTAEIDPGVRPGQRETVTICLPPSEVQGKSYIHRYDGEGEWERLPSELETVNEEELLCGETDSFSLFGVFVPVIESAEGVSHSEDAEDGFSLAPLGEGGSIVYGDRTIDLSVTGDVDISSSSPAVIVPRNVLDRVNEITFELSGTSPQNPPSGFRLSGFAAEVDLGVTLGEGETVAVCLPSAGGDIYRYNDDPGEWELVESRLETVNGEEVVCAETGGFSLTGVFVEETGGCAVAAAEGEGVRWQRAVFNLLLIISVLLLVPKLGVYDRKTASG